MNKFIVVALLFLSGCGVTSTQVTGSNISAEKTSVSNTPSKTLSLKSNPNLTMTATNINIFTTPTKLEAGTLKTEIPSWVQAEMIYTEGPKQVATTQKISATGDSLKTNSPDALTKFSTTPISIESPGLINSSGGGSSFSIKSLTAKENWLFYAAGLATFLIGGLFWYFGGKDFKVLLYFILAGLFFIMIGVWINIYPWIFILVPIPIICLIIYLVWFHKKSTDTTETLTGVVAGVETAPPAAQVEVKKSISQKVEEKGRAIISKIKGTL